MYKLKSSGVLRIEDNAHIPDDPRNGDWQTYTAWLEAGGVPLPEDAPPQPTVEDAIRAIEATITPRRTREALLSDEGKAWILAQDARIATLREQLTPS